MSQLCFGNNNHKGFSMKTFQSYLDGADANFTKYLAEQINDDKKLSVHINLTCESIMIKNLLIECYL